MARKSITADQTRLGQDATTTAPWTPLPPPLVIEHARYHAVIAIAARTTRFGVITAKRRRLRHSRLLHKPTYRAVLSSCVKLIKVERLCASLIAFSGKDAFHDQAIGATATAAREIAGTRLRCRWRGSDPR